ncbi:radical SAM protein [Anaerococcus sp. AGMB00486]|uniref:Radical SAM protein n=2 Tax=Anaerococcus TaxID=165779 RepID=A0ABX2N9U6_9FIRM|nr:MULTISPECIES: radical SAM protein [Anaerococcus]MSS77628.1 radical SAM protein [Anaerococcus porci]NVF11482.1 radical SAM protein [Anaerococcus faecalis]
MIVYLDKENLRKDVYDILNIFYERYDFYFVEEKSKADLLIEDKKIIYDGKEIFLKDKLDMKISLYEILEKITGKSSAWGILTGSKPLKLLKNHSLTDLKNIYKVSDKKIGLLKSVKLSQDKKNFNKNDFNIYINIPFCPKRCSYCSYPTIVSNTVDKKAYIKTIIKEISEINIPKKLDTIYIGGGTPSNLDIEDIERILEALDNKFSYMEFTFEAGREDSLDFDKLKLLKDMGVGRISLNPQTFTKSVLKNIDRPLDFDNFIKLYDYAKSLGFIINMDFIIGLFGESRESFRKNFNILEKLRPNNITFHALAQKVGSKFFENKVNGDKDEAYKISNDIENFIKENSYKPYYLYRQKNIIGNLENVGYEIGNTAQRYNILINEELENIIGLGMNSNTKLTNGKKYRNSRNLRDYYKNIGDEIYKKNKLIEEFFINN